MWLCSLSEGGGGGGGSVSLELIIRVAERVGVTLPAECEFRLGGVLKILKFRKIVKSCNNFQRLQKHEVLILLCKMNFICSGHRYKDEDITIKSDYMVPVFLVDQLGTNL